MSYMPKTQDVNLLQQTNRAIFSKVELLSHDFKILDSLEGNTLNYSISIDADSDIRRTCSLSLYVQNASFTPSSSSRIWMDKFLRIYMGLKDQRTQQTIWYGQGIFIIDGASYSFDASTQELSLSCSDLMSVLVNTCYNPQMVSEITIPAGSSARSVLISLLETLDSAIPYRIDDLGAIPYDLVFSLGTTLYEIMAKIRDLYPGWEFFFDTNGTFVFEAIPSGSSDPVVLDDTILQSLVVNESTDYDFSEVKNRVAVYGRTLDDGTQIYGEAKDTLTDSPFSISRIGERMEVLSGGDYDLITTNDLAQQRADYELWRLTRLNDGMSLETIAIYWLDVNQKIAYTSKITGVSAEYLIKQIAYSSTDTTMSLDMIKFYPTLPE
ncbi:DUF5048 domain-containing protein [Gehongia tenuis]|uniref:DUF5048 domain-containing protein n=1 Tax=Gehongia tenuis TaxID=2763655 RepID=A0A926D3W8_9FIRM|nr:DUF5048 domain-containing protein [Gehongia tenuis]MBC8531925.1 DUF5048 domain-containing protein [Gehongia tenuis]